MATVKTYAARRLLNMPGNKARAPGHSVIGSGEYERGELVPEAHLWTNVDSYAGAGSIEEVEVEEEEFRAAIAQYAPEQEQEILARVGLDREGLVLTGTQRTPVHPDEVASTQDLAGLIVTPQTNEEPEASPQVTASRANVCPECGREFKSPAGVEVHRTRMHPEAEPVPPDSSASGP
jgi:hypothetical protein